MNKKKCTCCGKEKKMIDYYSSSSHVYKLDGTVSICKQCIWDYVKPEHKNMYDMSLIKGILRMIDKPFIQSLWESSVNESERRDTEYFKTYMKNVAMQQYQELTWLDSEFDVIIKDQDVQKGEYELDELSITESDLKRFRKMWGDFSVKDYMFLEEFYGEYVNNFPTDTPAQVNIYKNLAKIHLQAEKALEDSKIKEYKDLMELSSKMHNDANIKPIQSSGANDDKGLSTYGLWIKEIESSEPCEFFEDKAIYEDYDGFRKYLEQWFLRPMKNIFNVSRDFDVDTDNNSVVDGDDKE